MVGKTMRNFYIIHLHKEQVGFVSMLSYDVQSRKYYDDAIMNTICDSGRADLVLECVSLRQASLMYSGIFSALQVRLMKDICSVVLVLMDWESGCNFAEMIW